MSLDVELYIEVDTGGDELYRVSLYEGNITHNLNTMAEEAGIYSILWCPDGIAINQAGEIIDALSVGLEKMKHDPKHYKQFDSPNGWGLYEHFVPFVENYLAACRKHPLAKIYVSR